MDHSPSRRCLALSVEGLACGSRGVRIDLCRGIGPDLRRWREIGANAGKLSAVIAVCWRRRGRSSIQNQNECKYRCQRYSKNFRVEVIEFLFRRLLRFQDRISICQGGGNDGGRAPQRTPRLSQLAKIRTAADNFATKYAKLDVHKSLCILARELTASTTRTESNLHASLGRHEPVVLPEEMASRLTSLDKAAAIAAPRANAESKSLSFSEYENKIIGLLERLKELRETFFHYDKCSKTVAVFETQIRSLSTIFDRFVAAQNGALQAVLDAISEDVGSFYHALHPAETVDRVRLRMVGEEGVEFEYFFHGVPTHPPMKYLSESHLNSLGVVLFLASAKLFNKESRFLVLDDIVTSFDINHRRRLLRLLRDEFADWQIILLTHEAFWFDIIKRELAPQRWITLEVVCDDENGIQIEPSAKDLKDLILAKRVKYDVSNDLRKLLEATLKEICCSCDVKMAFRYNDQNERRMSGELLSELRSTVNQKCAELKGNPIFSQLEASNLVATIGSHDNPEPITGGDIDVALADIDKLAQLFSCQKCGRYVEAENQLAGKGKITCRCGTKELDWK